MSSGVFANQNTEVFMKKIAVGVYLFSLLISIAYFARQSDTRLTHRDFKPLFLASQAPGSG